MAALFVVATPIGNLEDLTPRAARVLREVPVLAAESVNRAKKLLSHLGIRGKRLISCREANRVHAAREVLEALEAGQDVAYVSDAGTPGVSDPGSLLVRQAAAAGHRVCPLPGPSALAAALSVAGMEAAPAVFLGFAPAKSGARRRLFAQAAQPGWPLAIFEAPHRLAETVADLLAVLGDRPVTLAREVSKIHEEVAHTTLARLAEQVSQAEPRGEITLVVAGGPLPQAEQEAQDQVEALLRAGLEQGQESPSRLAKKVAAATGQPREEVYRRLLALKNQDQDQELDSQPDQHEQDLDDSETEVESQISPGVGQEKLHREFHVNNSLGLHARVAARIAQTVGGYQCQVLLGKDGMQADAASVLSILTLDAPQGSTLTVEAGGLEAGEALAALEELFLSGFGEN